jgi:iron complex transport system substrate-binding protein
VVGWLAGQNDSLPSYLIGSATSGTVALASPVSPIPMPPSRIICLSAETTETLYLLGEQNRIAGISGFTTRPPQARREKPRVAAFTTADIDRILALEPDLVIGFSDLQRDLLATLRSHGVAVHWFDQRSIAGILQMIRELGALVGAHEKSALLAAELERHVSALRSEHDTAAPRPRVYFEEWNEPLITAIGWVSELIDIAGGSNCFAEVSTAPLARERVIEAHEVVRRAPDIIIASWCGKRFRRDELMRRPGWSELPAVRNGQVHEIASSLILQPGPGALTEGLDAFVRIIEPWRRAH